MALTTSASLKSSFCSALISEVLFSEERPKNCSLNQRTSSSSSITRSLRRVFSGFSPWRALNLLLQAGSEFGVLCQQILHVLVGFEHVRILTWLPPRRISSRV